MTGCAAARHDGQDEPTPAAQEAREATFADWYQAHGDRGTWAGWEAGWDAALQWQQEQAPPKRDPASTTNASTERAALPSGRQQIRTRPAIPFGFTP